MICRKIGILPIPTLPFPWGRSAHMCIGTGYQVKLILEAGKRNKLEKIHSSWFQQNCAQQQLCENVKASIAEKSRIFNLKISDDLKRYLMNRQQYQTHTPLSAWGWPLDYASPFYAYTFPKLVSRIYHHHCNASMGTLQKLQFHHPY